MTINNIIRFIILVAVQVIILNKINFSGYVDPYLYVFFILVLPFSIPRGALLLLGFFTGAVIDVFSHTYGVHAAATTFMAFARPGVIRMVSKKQEYETASAPGISEMGLRWFYFYSLVLILLHHTVLFVLEAFSLDHLILLAYRIVLNAVVTLALVFIVHYLFPSRK